MFKVVLGYNDDDDLAKGYNIRSLGPSSSSSSRKVEGYGEYFIIILQQDPYVPSRTGWHRRDNLAAVRTIIRSLPKLLTPASKQATLASLPFGLNEKLCVKGHFMALNYCLFF